MIAPPPRRTGVVARIVVTAMVAVGCGPAAISAPSSAAAAPPTTHTAAQPELRLPAVRDGQWQLAALNATAAWRLSTGAGVTVAVIDSGVDASHPDLAGQVLSGTDLVEPGGNGHRDPVGHGTTVAALIAGRDDAHGASGLAPDAKILPVRVLDEENRYDDSLTVAKAVRWAVDNGAQVINLSLGGTAESPALGAAIEYAFARDVVVVACTGNLTSSAPAQVWYPAREPGVIAVTGLRKDSDELWSGSLTGKDAVLAAPATGLIGARPGGYWRVQGTSFAAPLVAAAAALIRSRWPEMSAGDVVNRLIHTARDLGPEGRDAVFGFGRVDPVAALTASVPGVPSNPLDDTETHAMTGIGTAPELDREHPDPVDKRNIAGGRFGQLDAGWASKPVPRPEQRSMPGLWMAALAFGLAAAGGVVLLRRSTRALGRMSRRRVDPKGDD